MEKAKSITTDEVITERIVQIVSVADKISAVLETKRGIHHIGRG